MTTRDDAPADVRSAALALLRRNHLLRGGLYLAAGAAVLQGLSAGFRRSQPHHLERLHLVVLPLTLGITRAFAELRPEDRRRWLELAPLPTLAEAARGAGLGAAAILSVLGAAAARGWVSAPAWGWERAPADEVARSVGLIAVGHLAVALNEELIFRGYGYETLRLALPEPAAAGLLVLLFGLAHPLRPQTLLGEMALGLALHALRRRSGGIWAAVGYHWAWNVVQVGVLGPADGQPSLRPLRAHGLHRWIGRPGYPDPGLLSMIVNLLVALVAHRNGVPDGGEARPA